ncbi:MAG TPA: cbb3-type cytochrome oxidase assembly protein CcoS [Dongiaceae bacterium]|jgi:cbb3-type cytochrome oxidase maturation protein|nr:cbb3-type cytochrome oxidase assembly protein CcoS [Dongiaceae bacterium]
MTNFLYLIPVALAMGAIGLGAFLWSLGSGQYEDLDGAAERILLDEDDVPAPDGHSTQASTEPPRTPPAPTVGRPG